MIHRIIHWVTWILVVIGALNWGLFGLFQLDLVNLVLGSVPLLAKIVYVLVGLSGLWMVVSKFFKRHKK
jgi:uncharacterized protein